MRRTLLAFALATLASLSSVVPACSSNGSSAADVDAGGDGAIAPNQPLGAPCNPSLPSPCFPGSPCYEVSCDPTLGVCVEAVIPGPCASGLEDGSVFAFDSGADVQLVGSGCLSSGECPDEFVCGFLVADACSATGQCVIPEPPTSTGGAVYMGCGCDGEPVSYVTATQTSAPVASGTPCSAEGEAGVDASDDGSADGGSDSAPDSGGQADASDANANASDAAPDSSVDASGDATTDATSDASGDATPE